MCQCENPAGKGKITMLEIEGRLAKAMSFSWPGICDRMHRTGFSWEPTQLSMETAGKTENLGTEMDKWVYPLRKIMDILFRLLCSQWNKKQGQHLWMRMERETLGHEILVQVSEWTTEMPCDCQVVIRARLRFVVTSSSHAELHICRYRTDEGWLIIRVRGLPGEYNETWKGKRVKVYAGGVYKNETRNLSWVRREVWESEDMAEWMEQGSDGAKEFL